MYNKVTLDKRSFWWYITSLPEPRELRMSHLHRITLEVDVITAERLGTTKDKVQELAFEAIRQHYKINDVVVIITDADCMVPHKREI